MYKVSQTNHRKGLGRDSSQFFSNYPNPSPLVSPNVKQLQGKALKLMNDLKLPSGFMACAIFVGEF